MKAKNVSEKALGAIAACISIGLFLILWGWGTAAASLGLLIPGPIEVWSERFHNDPRAIPSPGW